MKLSFVIFAVLGVTLSIVAQEIRRDGNWEVTTEMSMPDMPNMPRMPATTSTQCITPEEAKNPQSRVPPGGRGQPSDCKVSDYKSAGNKETFSMACPSNGTTGTGEFEYGAGTYTGTMKMSMNRGGQTTAMNMKISGKRLGDCTTKGK